MEWIPVENKLPERHKDVECLNWDDEIFVDCVQERCTGRPTDYGHTPSEECLPEGVIAWRYK